MTGRGQQREQLILQGCITFCFFFPERTFEDHENLVEPLLAWTRDSQNKILFQERPEKNEVFKNPQVCPSDTLASPPDANIWIFSQLSEETGRTLTSSPAIQSSALKRFSVSDRRSTSG